MLWKLLEINQVLFFPSVSTVDFRLFQKFAAYFTRSEKSMDIVAYLFVMLLELKDKPR
jgi:hypothetical protein